MNHLNHIAIIMDGNGRWAQERGMPRSKGHLAGAKKALQIVDYLSQTSISTLSLFAFSAHNWQRPAAEVNFLMKLFTVAIDRQKRFLMNRNIKVRIIGGRSKLPERVQGAIEKIEALTANNSGLNLLINLNYSGQRDIWQALQRLVREQTNLETLSMSQLERYLLTSGTPNPDLVIRSGGEQRLSNFYLWQIAFAEIYYEMKLWPDFEVNDLIKYINKYSHSDRRFGGVGAANTLSVQEGLYASFAE